MYYRICPICGCSLDPDERCDCERDEDMDGIDDYTMPARPMKRIAYADEHCMALDEYIARRRLVTEA